MRPEIPRPLRELDPQVEGDRACADLQSQMRHARALMDRSRQLFRAAASEPRSFRRED
jgi:hypothetical protein